MQVLCDLKCYIINVFFCIKVCIKSFKLVNLWVFIFIFDFIIKYNFLLIRIFQLYYVCVFCIKVCIKSIYGILFLFLMMIFIYVCNIIKYNFLFIRKFQFFIILVDIIVIFLFECLYFDVKGNIKLVLIVVFSLNYYYKCM